MTAEGLDGCFDCSSEVYVLERYLERFPSMLAAALGSQLNVQPQPSAPATALKLDNTLFNDPAWQAKQRAREAARMPKLRIELRRDDADGAAEEGEEATMTPAEGAEDAMGDEAASAAAAAAASPAEATASPSPSATNDAMSADASAAAAVSSPAQSAAASGDAMGDAPTAAAAAAASSPSPSNLSAAEQLKLNVGKFSQELSRRLTKGGTRTLATVNAQVIKKAAFSRKNRL